MNAYGFAHLDIMLYVVDADGRNGRIWQLAMAIAESGWTLRNPALRRFKSPNMVVEASPDRRVMPVLAGLRVHTSETETPQIQ